MTTQELLKKVRKIEIKTKGMSNQIFSGEYHSAFKGRGMTFSEVRGYAHGDEIRTIDWNVTARFNEPYVKVFEEEREITVMLLLDLSASENFASLEQSKRELIAELAALLSFSAAANNDKIGAILFTTGKELYIPPKKGRKHILRIIREVIQLEPKNKGTNISEALRYFSNTVNKKSIAFLISDFYDSNYKKSIQIANKRHDVIGIRVHDALEKEIPKIGYVPAVDSETGNQVVINTNRKSVRNEYKKQQQALEEEIVQNLRKSNVDYVSIQTGEDYIPKLKKLFNKRLIH